MSLRIKFWGVRGSLPATQLPQARVAELESLMQNFFKAGFHDPSDVKNFLSTQTLANIGGYGSATTCVEVASAKERLLIDGGSGLKSFNDLEMKRPDFKKGNTYHIFMTHFHWDHLLGLPFFAPHFIPGNTINYYAVQPELEDLIRGKFRKPYFPVSYESLRGTIQYHRLEPRVPFQLGDMSITPYQLDHPDPCWGYKIECGGKVFSHCVDTEGTRVTPSTLGLDHPLYQGVDVMYFDAQYTLPELVEKMNWGHSAAQVGLDLAFREKIRYVLFGHHDPGASNHDLHNLKEQTREYYEWKLETAETNRQELPKVRWKFAYEGLELNLSNLD